MKLKPPAYYRARLSAIADAIAGTRDNDRLRFLRNGYMPELVIKDYSRFDNRPLDFVELCSWDTWFAMYPEKVCGITVTATSRSFPLAVKGTKEDIYRTIMHRESEAGLIQKAEQELTNLIF